MRPAAAWRGPDAGSVPLNGPDSPEPPGAPAAGSEPTDAPLPADALPPAPAPPPADGTPPADAMPPAADPGETPPPARPGLSTFTIEGRAAPGLFVVGWLATLLGLGVAFVGFTAGGGTGVALLSGGLLLLSIGLVSAAGSQAIERRARGVPGYTGPSPVLLFAAAIAVSNLLAIIVGAPLAVAGIDASRPVADLLLVTIQNGVVIGLVAMLVVGTGALSWREVGFRATGIAADIGWGAVLAGPVILVSLLVTALLVGLLGAAPEGPLPPTGQASGLFLHLVAGAIVAPLGEEVLFRGVATTAWVRTAGARAGILRAALFFALVHVIGITASSFEQGLALAVVGFGSRLPVALVLGWVFVRRGSIWAPLGLHAAFNATLIVLSELALTAGS